MKRLLFIFHLSSFIFFLAACAPSGSAVTPQIVEVYTTVSASPWMDELFACAEGVSVALNVSPHSPDIFLRLGEPADLATPTFQIGMEDILIAVNKQSPLGDLTLEQVRTIFSGQGDPSMQIWLYASSEDVQEVFDEVVMEERRHSSFARLAFMPFHMSRELEADPKAIGVLPRTLMTDQLRELYAIPSVPVLALTPAEPEGATRELIACMQK